MKKIIKNPIFTFILGAIIFGSVGVIATNYAANEITYKNTTVKDALDDLYKNKNETSTSTKEITSNGIQTLDKYYNKINVNVEKDIDDIIVSSSDDYTTTEECSKVYVVVTRTTPPVFKRNNVEITAIKTFASPDDPYYTYTYYVENVEKNESWEFKGKAELLCIK